MNGSKTMDLAKTFIVRSALNPKLILCTNGDWKPESMMGPGGFAAKVFKTRAGASKVRSGQVLVEARVS